MGTRHTNKKKPISSIMVIIDGCKDTYKLDSGKLKVNLKKFLKTQVNRRVVDGKLPPPTVHRKCIEEYDAPKEKMIFKEKCVHQIFPNSFSINDIEQAFNGDIEPFNTDFDLFSDEINSTSNLWNMGELICQDLDDFNFI